MDIYFKQRKWEKLCMAERKARKELGEVCARKLFVRLNELRAAANLGLMRKLPNARCHELNMNRAGQFAVDLEHPRRLVFEPANEPIPLKPDGGIDWDQVTAIRILEVIDYHGE